MAKDCKDCEPGSGRPATYPGPRCYTHHRARKRALSARNHARRVEVTYGLREGEYGELLDAQGGVCALCQKPFGRKRGAVDHDHDTGRVRGIIHGWENTIIGRIGNSRDWAMRLYQYLTVSPAKKAGLDRKPGDV